MRLIDADAEIAKIEQEIQKTKSRIKEWEENREDRGGYYNVDEKISQFKSNILQAQTEIECLKRYDTAYNVDNVMERSENERKPMYRADGSLMAENTLIEIDKAVEIAKFGGVIG